MARIDGMDFPWGDSDRDGGDPCMARFEPGPGKSGVNCARYARHDGDHASLIKNNDGSYRVGCCWPNFGTETKVNGMKFDADKPRWDLIPLHALKSVTMALTYGAKKYAPNNWQRVGGGRWRYFRAAIGHIVAWRFGEKNDPESGLPHLAHAACNVMFLLDMDERGEEFPPDKDGQR